MSTARGVLDTSVFIAAETGRVLDLDALPDLSAVSVITLGELRAGVLAAANSADRARRLATLDAAGDVELLAVDEQVAVQWARLRVHLAETGRRMGMNDLWIAAVAVANDLPVVSQDNDFDALLDAEGFTLIMV